MDLPEPSKSATDVLVDAMDDVSRGDGKYVVILIASENGEVLSWRSNVSSNIMRIGLLESLKTGMFTAKYKES